MTDVKTDSNSSSVTVVIGDGWAALGSVGFLAQAGHSVVWVSGTGARVIPPLASIEAGPGASIWAQLAARLGVETGAPKTGNYLREFRNKAFREAPWTKAPTPEMRAEVRDESLWGPECRYAGAFETRFELPIGEIEEKIRQALSQMPNIRRIDAVPVQGFRFAGEGKDADLAAVVLGSGDEIACSRVIYADRWSVVGSLEGLPKPLAFLRGREPMGVLQAMLTHAEPVGAGLLESFYCQMHKEAGEETPRSLWGSFSSDGTRSVWSVFLTNSEVEDNHEIAKKLRRMKQTLDRMFTGTEWVPAGKTEFNANVQDEQVRFEEALIFAGGKPPHEIITAPKSPGVFFMTDGYGPASALHQVALLLSDEAGIDVASAQAGESEETVQPEAAV